MSPWTAAALVLLALLIGILIGLWLRGRHRHHHPPPPPGPGPGPTIPDHLEPAAVVAAINVRIAGAPADGSAPTSKTPPDRVVWVEGGDEVLVHLDRTQVQAMDGMLLVSVELETDQTGRQALIVPLALGAADDPAGLVATTDELPRGEGLLAARWGKAVQAAVWEALLRLASDHAGERGKAPRGFSVGPGGLRLHAGDPLRAVEDAP